MVENAMKVLGENSVRFGFHTRALVTDIMKHHMKYPGHVPSVIRREAGGGKWNGVVASGSSVQEILRPALTGV